MPRDPEQFEYRTVTKTGKITEDTESISKIIAFLKSTKARSATLLGKKLEDLLQQQHEVDAKLEGLKAEIRPFIEEVFDAKDSIWTRVIETGKLLITMSKATTRQSFDREKFMDKIAKEFPNLAGKFQEIAKECIAISNVASKLDVKMKSEGIGDTIKNIFTNLKNEISKVVNKIKSYLPSYDTKLESWKKELEANIVEEENATEQQPTEEQPTEEQPTEEAKPANELFNLFYKKYISEANKWL